MITVIGFDYYNDNRCPKREMEFNNLGNLAAYIQKQCVGKQSVKLPAQNEDGSFDQQYASTFSGHLSYQFANHYDGNPSTRIEMITDDNGKILFSSGSLTDGKGHISLAMKEMLLGLKEWKESPYDFAD